MKIMVCYDGSDSSRNALEWVVENFKAQKPDMILLSVAEGAADASLENEAIFEEMQGEAHDALKKGADWTAQQGLEVDVMLATGESRQMIMKAIEKKSPDLVVVARQRKTEYIRHFLSSVSAHLVRNAGCHLLILGPQ